MGTVQPFIEKLKANRALRQRQAAASPFRKWDDPILKQVCAPVVAGEDVSGVIKQMRDAVAGVGVGLAAPQIGHALRIVIIAPPGDTPVVMINPKIIAAFDAMDWADEGCLSYPGVKAMIQRHTEVMVEFTSETNERHVSTFSGFPARIVQHECDHLDGICKVGDAWRRKGRTNARVAMVTAGVLAAMGGVR